MDWLRALKRSFPTLDADTTIIVAHRLSTIMDAEIMFLGRNHRNHRNHRNQRCALAPNLYSDDILRSAVQFGFFLANISSLAADGEKNVSSLATDGSITQETFVLSLKLWLS